MITVHVLWHKHKEAMDLRCDFDNYYWRDVGHLGHWVEIEYRPDFLQFANGTRVEVYTHVKSIFYSYIFLKNGGKPLFNLLYARLHN